MNNDTRFYLLGTGARPDFRLLVTFVWGGIEGVETNGDADNPASRSWTWLVARTKSKPLQELEVDKASDEPNSLVVSGNSAEVAARAAYFLALEMGANVRVGSPRGAMVTMRELEQIAGSSSIRGGLETCAVSIWRKSSPANPYPNLESDTGT
jgi:hypothetical protein